VIEPQRMALIPAFAEVRGAAMAAGALGCSISGAGPTMFAWALTEQTDAVLQGMLSALSAASIEADGWIVDINAQGARLIEP
jgi:homoserine kinase